MFREHLPAHFVPEKASKARKRKKILANRATSVGPPERRMSLPGPPGTRTICQAGSGEIAENSPPLPPHPPPSPQQTSAPDISSDEDLRDVGEERLIADFGPNGRNRGLSERGDAASFNLADPELVQGTQDDFKLKTVIMDARHLDERGLARRMMFDPSEMARALQPINERGARFRCISKRSSSKEASVLVHRLVKTLETALDPTRPGRESLLICKSVTDAYLVNAKHLHCAIGNQGLMRMLRSAWRHAVGHWNGGKDEPHSAADLHLVRIIPKTQQSSINLNRDIAVDNLCGMLLVFVMQLHVQISTFGVVRNCDETSLESLCDT